LFHDAHGSIPHQCLNDCVYTISGTSRPKFCFARGDLIAECLDSEEKIVVESQVDTSGGHFKPESGSGDHGSDHADHKPGSEPGDYGSDHADFKPGPGSGPDCVKPCDIGLSYTGSLSTTASGRTCKAWAEDSRQWDEPENFCRNPDNDSGGLWCFTTDPDKSWEYCAPPICEDANESRDVGCVDENDVLGKNYTGGQRTTKSGRTCQHWCSTSPHYHRQESPDLEDNFCRNPDNEPGGPWCYTTDPAKRWEYCGVPTCPKPDKPEKPETSEGSKVSDCIAESDNGSDYEGSVAVTVTGATCNKWSDADLGGWEFSKLGDWRWPHNLCRNPDNSILPWCYVAGTKDSYYSGVEGRAFCDIPACPADPSAPTCRNWGKGEGGDYRGTVSTTRSGATCEKWSKADLGPWGRGERGKWRYGHNHCRNPNKADQGPWCYVPGTKDSYRVGMQGWEYCAVPYCEGEDKGAENPDMYYCEFMPDHTMCKYKGPTEECAKKEKFTGEERAELVKAHNDLRRRIAKGEEPGQPEAANMMEMVWDEEMEEIAQRWTDQCNPGHDKNNKLLDGTYCGQNAARGMDTMTSTVGAWYGEVKYMDAGCTPSDAKICDVDEFGSGTRKGEVEHYTQVVWAESSRLGCGKRGLYVVCNYLSGNMPGGSMYKRGQACSACPEGTTCADGLCRAAP